MPQVRLECSRRLAGLVDTGEMFSVLHATLVETVNAGLSACKSRLSIIENVYIQDGADSRDMAHLEIGLLPGRSAEQKTALGTAALELLRTRIAGPGSAKGLEVSVSVRLYEMDAATYFKETVAAQPLIA